MLCHATLTSMMHLYRSPTVSLLVPTRQLTAQHNSTCAIAMLPFFASGGGHSGAPHQLSGRSCPLLPPQQSLWSPERVQRGAAKCGIKGLIQEAASRQESNPAQGHLCNLAPTKVKAGESKHQTKDQLPQSLVRTRCWKLSS